MLLDPECALLTPDVLHPSFGELYPDDYFSYTKEQYLSHIEFLKQMESKYENLKIHFVSELADNTLLYVKEDTGVVMTKANAPKTAFVINERNMIGAFWDYMEKRVLT